MRGKFLGGREKKGVLKRQTKGRVFLGGRGKGGVLGRQEKEMGPCEEGK